MASRRGRLEVFGAMGGRRQYAGSVPRPGRTLRPISSGASPERSDQPAMTAAAYRQLLAELDAWFASGVSAAGGLVPCRGGCSACCHGPFDISVADAELLREAVAALPEPVKADVVLRAAALLERMRALEPGWSAPYAVAALGEERFDRLTEVFADQPCPLLDDAGRCRIYADRPLVCRLIGLPLRSLAGRVIENTCPIQDRFPGYPSLAPVPFDLEAFEEREAECLSAAAERRFGTAAERGFETTIAAEVGGERGR